MPGTDAETVVSSYEALNERDVDGAMGALADDSEWHESEVLPTPVIALLPHLLDGLVKALPGGRELGQRPMAKRASAQGL